VLFSGAPSLQQQPCLPTPPYKPVRTSPEQIQENIDMLMQNTSIQANWKEILNFLHLGGISLLLKVIAYAYEWNYSGRLVSIIVTSLDILILAYLLKINIKIELH
jgi:HIV-1 Vpr-binding protein